MVYVIAAIGMTLSVLKVIPQLQRFALYLYTS